VKVPWVERALAFKAGVVHRDPREAGERRLLNLGHTLGHALEAASGYQLLHGEAVGLGLLGACLLAEEQGLKPFPASLLDQLTRRLMPLASLVAPWSDCLPLLARDKKATQVPGLTEEAPATMIQCILPRPNEPAVQRSLPPQAWESTHARLLSLLHQESLRA
jgi:3-dehydroquinate synthase